MDNRLTESLELVIRLEQRALTSARLDQAVWKIWGNCRDNRESMDAERQGALIRSVVESAVGDVERRIEQAHIDLARAKQRMKSFRRDAKELEKELAGRVANLEKENRKLKKSRKPIHLANKEPIQSEV